MKPSLTKSRWFRLLSLMGLKIVPYLIGIIISGLAIAYCFNIVLGFVFKNVLDAALAGESTLLLRATVLALVTFVIGMPSVVLSQMMVIRAVCRTLTSVRMALFSKIARLPMARVEERHSGDLISRATNDVQTVWAMLFNTLPPFAGALIMGTIGMGAIFLLNWQLGLVALVVGLASLGTSTGFARLLRRRSDALQAAAARMTERLADLIAGIPVARMFQLEETLHQQYATASSSSAEQTIAHARSQAAFEATQRLLGWIQRFGTLTLGLLLFSRGTLLVGAVWAIVHVQGNANYLFTSIGQLVTGIQRGLAGGQRVLEIFDVPEESERKPTKPDQTHPIEGALSLSQVSFSYAGNGGARVLQELSLDVASGSVAALVGPSGGGKSTLLKLLLGFYLPQEGELQIGGLPITGNSLQLLRDQTAYVPQNAFLFNGTIEENIGYGKANATKAQIVTAAKAAYAHDFITHQPEGYMTQVGEGGSRLSGGQRQRIAIARALLKDAPILLLDEATSALDTESEQQVQAALDVLMRGRTTVAVAHRLSTIKHADRIFVLDAGRIVEQGSHEELLAEDGLYRQLVELQFAT